MANIFEEKPELEVNENEEMKTFLNLILSRVKNYFEIHKFLKHENLSDFVDSITISNIIETYEEKEMIWDIFTKLSEVSNEIDFETCKKGIIELFSTYVGSEKENKNNITEFNFIEDNRFLETGMITKTNSNPIYIKNQLQETFPQKERKLEELRSKFNFRKTLKRIPDSRTYFLVTDSVLINSNDNACRESIENLNRNLPRMKKIHNEDRITKIFKEIEIEKLKQLQKVFSLLDLRNKENVYISEIQNILNKYKFIRLSQDEIINYMSLLSDDLLKDNYSNGNNIHKLSINFELYTNAMCTMKKLLLQSNISIFSEKSNSYYIYDNYSQIIDDLHNTELESIDYVLILTDFLKFIEHKIYYSIIENYEKILNKEYSMNDSEESVRKLINEGEEDFKNKLTDMNIFLKEINYNSSMKQNKLAYLKWIVNKIEENLKNIEDDYRILFQKFNMSRPIEINEETEHLMKENSHLNEQQQLKKVQVELLQKHIDEKDEQIFNLESKLDKLMINKKELELNYNLLQDEYESLRKNYDSTINEIYEKINMQDNIQSNKKVIRDGDKENHNIRERDTIIKFREKLIISEENKKIFDLNYEQLILYTLNIDFLNKQLEEKNLFNKIRIKDLERECCQLTKTNIEISKSIQMLKSENTSLLSRIHDLNREVEINLLFRPSKVLGNRISKINEEGQSNLIISERFKNTQNVIKVENKKKFHDHIQERNSEVCISQIKLGENLQINNDEGNNIKLEHIEQNQNFEIKNDPNNIPNNNLNKKSFKYDNPNNSFSINNTNINLEPLSITNNNVVFSKKDSFSITEKYLFDEKRNDNKQIDSFASLDNLSESKNITGSMIKKPPKEYFYLKEEYKTKKEIIVDCLLEVNENLSIENKSDNVSVNLESIVRHSPIDIDINLDKREKLKQIVINNKVNQVSNGNKNSKAYSLMNEEILEENANGEIIGKGIRNSIRNSRRKTISPKSLCNSSLQNESNNFQAFSHNRFRTIEDLGIFLNKDSQNVCYDFLTLRKTESVIKMLEDNREDISSYEMFSDNIYLINQNNKKSKEYLYITSNYIYILGSQEMLQKTRRNLRKLDKITISNKNCNLIAFHFTEGDDLLLEILRRMELLYFFRDLYRLKRYGKLKFKYSDNFKIKRNGSYSNIIVNQVNNFFIAPNFDSAQKLGYLSKLTGRIFKKFSEKLVVLTNVGLLYFDDPNKPPKKLIPIIGSSILKVDEKKYKRKFCFEIQTLNGNSYVFATNSVEELESWMLEFKLFKKNYDTKIKNIDNFK